MVEPLTRTELSAKYPDVLWRERFLDLLSLVDILGSCVIDSKFKVSDELNRAIALTSEGKRVRDQLVTKEEVEPKDANLLCLLALVHIEPLVDIETVDLDRLVEAISGSVKSRRLRFPFIFGRALYDGASALFKEERDQLRHEDTMRLLGDGPQGVFQTGYFLLGPYGVHKLHHRRSLSPDTLVPLQHCADLACPLVHDVRLTTSYEPGVNRNRPALYKVLDQVSSDPSDWNGFVSDLVEDRINPYEEADRATLPYLLGDAFDDSELRAILQRGTRSADGGLSRWAEVFGVSGAVKDWLPALNRAEMMQLLLTQTDQSLVHLIDDCIRDGEIEIPAGEVRTPMVNHRARSGAWRQHSEVSDLGYRAISTNSSLTLLRLSALVRSLFDAGSAQEMDDLAWILRAVRGTTTNERLEAFLRNAEPAVVLRTLVLARRGNAEKAAAALGIKEVPVDEAFLDAMLWKLGFSPQRRPDIRDAYWKQHELLENISKTAAVTLGLDEDQLRAFSSNYFVALERFLFDSLIFATWSLLTDHFTSEKPFVFYESVAREFTIQVLNSSTVSVPGERRNDLTEEPDLNLIVQGFIRLSRHLESLRNNDIDHLRPNTEFPKFVKKTSLQRFPFKHSIPFLDLTSSSQMLLVNRLGDIGKRLNDSGIMTARNGLLHAKSKQRTPTIVEVNGALNRARNALDKLEEIGCVRTTFKVAHRETDSWGRGVTVMESHGNEIKFSSPSGFDMVGLPSMTKPLYLLQGAVFADPNEMLRFREGFESKFTDYWAHFPVRPEPGNRAVANKSEALVTGIGAAASALQG